MAGVKGKGGQKGRSGRKPKAHELSVQELMDTCWTAEQRQEMVKAWAARAAQGDLEAGKLLMAYTYGKPNEHKTVTLNLTEEARDAYRRIREELNLPAAKARKIVMAEFGIPEAELLTESVH